MEIFIYIVFVLCANVLPVNSQNLRCKALEKYSKHLNTFKDHLKSKNKNGESYMPKSSCFLCSIPDCDFSNPDCSKWSRTPKLPIYNNLLEFGFFYENMPNKFYANVTLAEDCVLQVHCKKELKDNEYEFKMFFYQCNSEKCVQVHEINSALRLNNIEHCIFFSFKFYNTRTIYDSRTYWCNHSSTPLLESLIANDELYTCPFNETSPLYVQYLFQHPNLNQPEGVPMIVPCSPGGYTIDPLTGRFVSGNFCKILFSDNIYHNDIKRIMERFYEVNDDYIFPIYSSEELVQRNPIYVDKDGNPRSVESMAPRKIYCEVPINRNGCEATPLPLPESITNDPRCVKEYHEFIKDKTVDDTVKTFEIPPLTPPLTPPEYQIIDTNKVDEPKKEKKAEEGSSKEVVSFGMRHLPELLSFLVLSICVMILKQFL